MQNTEYDIEVETESEVKATLPSMYKVVLHDDDKTTIEFVIMMLMSVFHKSADDAIQVTMDVHHNGRGIAGLYPKEIAHEKVKEATKLASEHKYPLKVTYEVD